MFKPTSNMPTGRIVMRPMHDTAKVVPFIFAVELNSVANLNGTDSLCEIDVVRNEDCLPGRQAQDKTLMTAAIVVICKYARHDTLALNLTACILLIKYDGGR